MIRDGDRNSGTFSGLKLRRMLPTTYYNDELGMYHSPNVGGFMGGTGVATLYEHHTWPTYVQNMGDMWLFMSNIWENMYLVKINKWGLASWPYFGHMLAIFRTYQLWLNFLIFFLYTSSQILELSGHISLIFGPCS